MLLPKAMLEPIGRDEDEVVLFDAAYNDVKGKEE
jgi:hypothetical protein